MMDNESKKILSLITMDKRQTEKKSSNMEKACLVRAMEELAENGVVVSEVVTDAHLQIGAVMSEYHFNFMLTLLLSFILCVLNEKHDNF